jgi:hypothetical protein
MSSSLDQLKNELLSDPLGFEEDDGVAKILAAGVSFGDLRGLIRRIYDLNEQQLIETSNANTGAMGALNRYSTGRRQQLARKRLSKRKEDDGSIKIFVEGDSWYQFPVFIRDIVDWLKRNKKFIILSDAYGGDWITNMIYEEKYIPGLSTYAPDIFLLSGGGNDIVGNHRLGILIDKDPGYRKKYQAPADIGSENLSDEHREMIFRAQDFMNKEFYALLLVFRLQYTLLFRNLYHPDCKLKHIISITQGYDYPYPQYGKRFSLRYPHQYLVNGFLKSGKWLYVPMKAKGIYDKDLQRAIAVMLIFEFNEMMLRFAS